MDLLLLGAGMGIVGGLIPAPLHMIALSQVALGRWARGILVLVGPPLFVDGILLLVTFFSYQYIPHNIAHYVAYVGGVVLVGFAAVTLVSMRKKSQEQLAESSTLTYAGVSVATLAEVTAPGTWVFWLTIAGPILSEGHRLGYWHVVPFFVGSAVGFYAAAIFAVFLMAWGASLHKEFKKKLFLAANVLLLVLGFSYLIRAYLGTH
jgi:threonine/homoserine/homoserine lactone efflux protein